MSIELFKLVFLLLTLKPNTMKQKFRYNAFTFLVYSFCCIVYTTIKILLSIFNTIFL